jgi:hypothetical protein
VAPKLILWIQDFPDDHWYSPPTHLLFWSLQAMSPTIGYKALGYWSHFSRTSDGLWCCSSNEHVGNVTKRAYLRLTFDTSQTLLLLPSRHCAWLDLIFWISRVKKHLEASSIQFTFNESRYAITAEFQFLSLKSHYKWWNKTGIQWVIRKMLQIGFPQPFSSVCHRSSFHTQP